MESPIRKPALVIRALLVINLTTICWSGDWSIQCASAWFPNSPASIITIPPEKINDGYCDCPLDGLDETETDACSGSSSWAGVGGIQVDIEGAKSFVCPQQLSLNLAFSRVNDGICDCCDGADEQESGNCPDICDQVMAAEQAARAKIIADYAAGSAIRATSIAQYETWLDDKKANLKDLIDHESALVKAKANLEPEIKNAKIEFSQNWAYAIIDKMSTFDSLTSLIGSSKSGMSEHMSVDDLSSLVISLCMLSGEISSDHIVNGRCVPFDRASIDVGIIWEHSDNVDSNSLPKFHYIDVESETSLLEYAEKIIALTEGNDTDEWSSKNKKKFNKTKRKREIIYDDDDDRDYVADEDYDEILEEDSYDDPDEEAVQDKYLGDENRPTLDEIVQSRVDKLHLSTTRNLFKEQADVLLKLTPPSVDDNEQEEGENESTNKMDKPAFDPAAMNMAKSTINKRMASILRGEASAKFAALHIMSLIKHNSGSSRSILSNMQIFATRMIYHSQISSDDIAEIIYSTSSTLRPDVDVDPSSCPASSPWSEMCPPKSLVINGSSKSFPPDFIVNAANRLCEDRTDAMVGTCTAQRELDIKDFPTTIEEGYYNYYSPKAREGSDEIDKAFNVITPYMTMPLKLSTLILNENKFDKDVETTKTEVEKLKREMGADDKFGLSGELFILRDTCHSVESGKYEYEVCIFGKATQRDIGQKNGGTHLGNWQRMEINDGVRTFKWTSGTKCWNGPHRSAEVIVNCGGLETKLLTAEEPETCRYVFTMESPIGCDEQFKSNNAL